MNVHYQGALNKAISWINKNFHPIGIIATGSIIRGNPHINSDFDIYVIHQEPYRQRVQKYFDEVPCEIFINNFKHIYEYFDQEYKVNKPVSAHMIATGTVLLGQANSEIKKLIEVANKFLLAAPNINDTKRTAMKYAISTLFEDATDIKNTDPKTCRYFLNRMVQDLMDFVFLDNGIPLPRPKERINYIELNYPNLGKLISFYYKAESFNRQYDIAEQLVILTCGEHGFFEWDSGKS